jgi:hypothetical protein
VAADRVEGDQHRDEHLDRDATRRVPDKNRGYRERGGADQQRRRRAAPPHRKRHRHQHEQHGQDAAAADDPQRRRRVPPEIELRPCHEDEGEDDVSPAVEQSAGAHDRERTAERRRPHQPRL